MKKIIKRLAGIRDKEKENRHAAKEEKIDQKYDEILDEIEDSYQEERERREEDKWLNANCEEGQLSVDIYQTPSAIVVKSTIAGVKPEDIDISINNDMLTIKGHRAEMGEVSDDDYLIKECYWGSFSRSIILPVEVQGDKIEAELENGILTVTLPKVGPAKKIAVKVKD